MDKRVFVIGVGMTKFIKPGPDNPDYPEFGAKALRRALHDAGIAYDQIEQASVGYVYGDSTCGQKVLYEVGMTGIPIYNVNNNCSTGSTALLMAYNAIRSGQNQCALALGFEKMEKGSLGAKFTDRVNPVKGHVVHMAENVPEVTAAPLMSQMFGNAGIEHMNKYGTNKVHFAKIAHKNHMHSVNNPYSQFRDAYTLDDIQNSPEVYGPLNKLACCPTSDGAAAAIVASEDYVLSNGLQDQAVEILGIEMTTDTPQVFGKSMISLVGGDMTRACAERVYSKAGVKPSDVQVVELHDCFAANELVTYEALGLCEEGKAGEFIDAGDNTYGGRYVVNPSGGLISKGHPLGATGLAQCAELNWQLRGMAGKRQVTEAKIALQHNLGLGGACVVAIYKKYNTQPGKVRPDQTADPDILEGIEATPRL